MTLTTGLRQLKKEHSLLTVSDTAELAGITPWWVRQLIAKGELRAINIGSGGTKARWRIDPEDLEAWLRTRESRPRDLTREAV